MKEKEKANEIKLPKRKNTTRTLLIILGVVVVLVGGIFGIRYLINRAKTIDAAFTINEKVYSKKDYEKVLKDPVNKGLSKKQINEAYIELEKKKYVANKIGANPSEEQMEAARKSVFPDIKKENLNTIQQLSVYEYAFIPALVQAGDNGYEGAVFVFPFNKRIQPYDNHVSGWKNPEAIDSDRKYALERANYYRDQLIEKKITKEKAVEEIKKDPRLAYVNAVNDSAVFTINDSLKQKLANKEIFDFISGLKKSGFTEIKTAKMYTELGGKKPEDSLYFFVDLEKLGENRGDLSAKFEKELKSLEVKIYIKD
ncbi:MAG: hypothetical protein Q8P54_00610 [bacterium]|nr:hypothetical protein [bacterium]